MRIFVVDRDEIFAAIDKIKNIERLDGDDAKNKIEYAIEYVPGYWVDQEKLESVAYERNDKTA